MRSIARRGIMARSALDDEDSESEGWESEEEGEVVNCLAPPPPPGAASMPVPKAPPPPLAVDTAKVWQYCPPPQDRNEHIVHVPILEAIQIFSLCCISPIECNTQFCITHSSLTSTSARAVTNVFLFALR